MAIMVIGYCALAYGRCDTASYYTFCTCEYIGVDAQVCCGDIIGTDAWDHAWIRIDGTNIETTTLNLYKTPYCDYDNPYFVSSDINEIRSELYDT